MFFPNHKNFFMNLPLSRLFHDTVTRHDQPYLQVALAHHSDNKDGQ